MIHVLCYNVYCGLPSDLRKMLTAVLLLLGAGIVAAVPTTSPTPPPTYDDISTLLERFERTERSYLSTTSSTNGFRFNYLTAIYIQDTFPTPAPTTAPTLAPTTVTPTTSPTPSPATVPTAFPTNSPTSAPTASPTGLPTSHTGSSDYVYTFEFYINTYNGVSYPSAITLKCYDSDVPDDKIGQSAYAFIALDMRYSDAQEKFYVEDTSCEHAGCDLTTQSFTTTCKTIFEKAVGSTIYCQLKVRDVNTFPLPTEDISACTLVTNLPDLGALYSYTVKGPAVPWNKRVSRIACLDSAEDVTAVAIDSSYKLGLFDYVLSLDYDYDSWYVRANSTIGALLPMCVDVWTNDYIQNGMRGQQIDEARYFDYYVQGKACYDIHGSSAQSRLVTFPLDQVSDVVQCRGLFLSLLVSDLTNSYNGAIVPPTGTISNDYYTKMQVMAAYMGAYPATENTASYNRDVLPNQYEGGPMCTMLYSSFDTLAQSVYTPEDIELGCCKQFVEYRMHDGSPVPPHLQNFNSMIYRVRPAAMDPTTTTAATTVSATFSTMTTGTGVYRDSVLMAEMPSYIDLGSTISVYADQHWPANACPILMALDNSCTASHTDIVNNGAYKCCTADFNSGGSCGSCVSGGTDAKYYYQDPTVLAAIPDNVLVSADVRITAGQTWPTFNLCEDLEGPNNPGLYAALCVTSACASTEYPHLVNGGGFYCTQFTSCPAASSNDHSACQTIHTISTPPPLSEAEYYAGQLTGTEPMVCNMPTLDDVVVYYSSTAGEVTTVTTTAATAPATTAASGATTVAEETGPDSEASSNTQLTALWAFGGAAIAVILVLSTVACVVRRSSMHASVPYDPVNFNDYDE